MSSDKVLILTEKLIELFKQNGLIKEIDGELRSVDAASYGAKVLVSKPMNISNGAVWDEKLQKFVTR